MEHAAVVTALVPRQPGSLSTQRDPQVRAALEQPQRGREADDAAADDDDVRHAVTRRPAWLDVPRPRSGPRGAQQRHRPLDLLAQDRERLGDARLAGARERPQERPRREHGASRPSASAISTSGPAPDAAVEVDLRPPSTASTTSSSTSIAAAVRSSWRPPWFETHTPSAPCSTASSASSAVRMPLSTSGSGDHDRISSSVPREPDAAHVEVLVHVGGLAPHVALREVRVGVLARIEAQPRITSSR